MHIKWLFNSLIASVFVICDTGMGTAGKFFPVNLCGTWASTYKRTWPTDTSDADPILWYSSRTSSDFLAEI